MHFQKHIYHLTEVTNWRFIEQHGLLSTRSLLDLFGIYGQQVCIEQCHRTERVVLQNGIVIRDQKPMPPEALKRCLIGMTPAQWYTLLNSKVFFWLDVERLNRIRRVDQLPQIVLVIEAKKLLRQYAERTTLTPINTGNARRQPARRGRQTFVPYNTWLKSHWASEAEALGTRPRSSSHKPVELTVADAVPDVMNFVLDVRWLKEGEELMQ